MPAKEDEAAASPSSRAPTSSSSASRSRRASRSTCSRRSTGPSPGTSRSTRTSTARARPWQSKEVQDLLKDGPDAGLKNWSLRARQRRRVGGLLDPGGGDEALDRASCSAGSGQAQAHDPTSHGYICAALDSRAPGVDVTVNCDTTHANFGKDVLSRERPARRHADPQRARHPSSTTATRARSRSAGSEVFGSAANIKPGCVFKVEVLRHRQHRGRSATASCAPFSGSSPQLTPGDGKYYRQRVDLAAPRRAGAGSRPPRRAARGPARASRPRRACRCACPAPRRGSRGTWRPAPPPAPRAPRSPRPPAAPRRRSGAPTTTTITARTTRMRRKSTTGAGCALRARRGPRRTRPWRVGAAGRRPQRDQPARERDQRADPDPGDHRRDEQPERGRRRVARVGARRGRRAPGRGTRRAARGSASRR